MLKVKENYYDILEYIYLEEEKKQSLEDRSVFISFKDHNNMEENIEEILKDKCKKEQLLKYLDKIAHIQFKIYSTKNYTIGMLDILKKDNKNRNIDISIYIQNFDMMEKNIYVFEKALKEIDDIYLKITEKTDKMYKKYSDKYDYTYYYIINIYDYLIHNMIYDASDIEDTEIPYIFRDRFAKIIKDEEQGIDRILCKYGTCGIFTNIIGVLLDKKNIPNAKIIGTLKDTAHVWNQVQIQGKWYNLDYINDINNIYDNIPLTKFLLSNQEFKDYKIFYTLQNGNGVQLQDVHLPNICTNNFINENINENEHEHENKVIIKYDFNNTVDYYKNVINVEKLIRRREDILFKIYYKEISLTKFLKYIKLNKELKYRYIIYINLKEIKKILELEQKEIRKILEILKQNIYYIAHLIIDLKDIKLQDKNSNKIKMIEEELKEMIEFSNVYVDIPQSLLIKDSEDIQIIIDNKY